MLSEGSRSEPQSKHRFNPEARSCPDKLGMTGLSLETVRFANLPRDDTSSSAAEGEHVAIERQKAVRALVCWERNNPSDSL
jgi:hypothetical protein